MSAFACIVPVLLAIVDSLDLSRLRVHGLVSISSVKVSASPCLVPGLLAIVDSLDLSRSGVHFPMHPRS